MLKSNASSTVNRNHIGITRKTVNPKIWPFSDVQSKNDVHDSVMCPLALIPGKPKPTQAFLPANEVIIRRNPPEDEKHQNYESVHRVFGPILATAQLFGLLPVSGICKSSPNKLSYQLLSPRTIYTIIVIIMLTFMTTLSVAHMIKTLNPNILTVNGGIAAATAGVVFYGNSFFGTIIFWWMAPRWINLQKEWRLMEQQLDSNKQSIPRLKWKFRMITIMVMIPALLEHIISVINNIPSNQLSENGVNATWKDYLKLYTYNSHGFILSSCRYNIALGLFLFIVSKIATFTWNFTDLFIMLVSTALAERYKTLYKNLNTVALDRSYIDWSEFRKHYACLSTLVKRTDNDISPIILLSFVNNLYFICLQLLNGLSPGEGNLLSSLYFFGSFGFLLGRTVAVTLLTARINDQSKIALPVLYNCSPLNYNIETQRLQYQLTTDDISLTGLRFFSITRNFMLAVGGAIVTYEVVLLQFNIAMKK